MRHQHIFLNININYKMIERKTNYRLAVVIGIATFGTDREESLKHVIWSLKDQCDKIIVYNNDINPDIADNGKFFGLTNLNEPVFYISCDDDLIVTDTYVQDIVEAIERLNTIVSFHGRQLQGLDRNYYYGHKSFRCLGEVNEEVILDVCGTGVTGWSTEYFNPLNLIYSKDLKMSDLIFSLEAAKQGKTITLLKHKVGYIKQDDIDLTKTIAGTECRKPNKRQMEIANEIYKIKHNLK